MSLSPRPAYGQQGPSSGASEFNSLQFIFTQLLARKHFCTLVQVKACTNEGGVEPVGFVDVQPLVNQLDGAGNAVPHTMLYGLPYFRLQGGSSAVIIDPAQGDIGLCIIAERDISVVKATKAQANPGSSRILSAADGLYLGGLLNGIPSAYIQFVSGNVNIIGSGVNISADGVTLKALVNELFMTLYNGHTHPIPGGSTGAPAVPMTSTELTSVLKAE